MRVGAKKGNCLNAKKPNTLARIQLSSPSEARSWTENTFFRWMALQDKLPRTLQGEGGAMIRHKWRHLTAVANPIHFSATRKNSALETKTNLRAKTGRKFLPPVLRNARITYKDVEIFLSCVLLQTKWKKCLPKASTQSNLQNKSSGFFSFACTNTSAWLSGSRSSWIAIRRSGWLGNHDSSRSPAFLCSWRLTFD